jgi:hypothetical protein
MIKHIASAGGSVLIPLVLVCLAPISGRAEVLPTLDLFAPRPAFTPSATNLGEFSFAVPGGDPISGIFFSNAPGDDYYTAGWDTALCESPADGCMTDPAAPPPIALFCSFSDAARAALLPALANGSIDLSPPKPSAQSANDDSNQPAEFSLGGSGGAENAYMVPIILAVIGLIGILVAGIARLTLPEE